MEGITGRRYKASDNIIQEEGSEGNQRIHFVPTPAWETSEMMENLCKGADEILDNESADLSLIILMFILDFLVR